MAEFYERLKSIRKDRGFTQEQMGKHFEIAARSYRYWEAGQREPSIANLKELCAILRVSADYLLGLTDEVE